MAVTIGRRELLAALGGAAAWPLAARGQQAGDRESAGQMPRVGWLWPGRSAGNSSEFAGFQQGLRELGYVEGKGGCRRPHVLRGERIRQYAPHGSLHGQNP